MRQLPRFDHLLRVSFVLAALCLIYIAYDTAGRVTEYYTPFPVWDYWRVAQYFPDMKAGHWGFLWKQHNDHRLVFPELVFAADMLWWHGQKILPLAATFLCYVGTWAFLSAPVIRDRHLNVFAGALACCLAGCVALWRSVALALGEPFLLQWTMCQMAVAGSLFLITRSRERESWVSFAAVVFTATVATYSSVNGMLVWPLLWAAALSIGVSKRQQAALIAAGAVAIATYFIGYHSSGGFTPKTLLSHPLLVIGFVTSYLSMPFGGLGSVEGRAGLIAGGVALAMALAVLVACLRRGWFREPSALVLLGFMLFDLLTALMTAAGRMSPADPTFGYAKAVRYLSIPQMNWGAALLSVLWIAARTNNRKIFAGAFLVVALLQAVYLPKLQPWIRANAEDFSEIELAALSYENGVPDETLAATYLFPDTTLIDKYSKPLKLSQKSIYYQSLGRWLGKPAAQFAPARPALSGAIVSTFPSGRGIQVSGWVDDAELRKPVLWIVLTDENGLIRGFGRRFEAGFPSTAKIPALPSSLAWAGYVPASMAGKRILAYAVDARKFGLMSLNADFDLPHVTSTLAADRGKAFDDITWTSQLNAKNDSVPFVPPGDLPPSPVHATYGGSDATTGFIKSSAFEKPADGCLIFPVMTGSAVTKLRAFVEDAKSGAVLAEMPLRSERSYWHFWRVGVNESHQSLRVAVQDEGRGWGEWIATSTPLHCQ